MCSVRRLDGRGREGATRLQSCAFDLLVRRNSVRHEASRAPMPDQRGFRPAGAQRAAFQDSRTVAAMRSASRIWTIKPLTTSAIQITYQYQSSLSCWVMAAD